MNAITPTGLVPSGHDARCRAFSFHETREGPSRYLGPLESAYEDSQTRLAKTEPFHKVFGVASSNRDLQKVCMTIEEVTRLKDGSPVSISVFHKICGSDHFLLNAPFLWNSGIVRGVHCRVVATNEQKKLV